MKTQLRQLLMISGLAIPAFIPAVQAAEGDIEQRFDVQPGQRGTRHDNALCGHQR